MARTLFFLCSCLCLASSLAAGSQTHRSMRFNARTPEEARAWQRQARQKLVALMMGGRAPERVPLEPRVVRSERNMRGGYEIFELSLVTRPNHRVRAWLSMPMRRSGPMPAVLAIHGHGGTGEQIARGTGLYWYGRALAEMGYVVIAPDVGSHTLTAPGWSLMGERTWDAIRCLDYLETRPEVDRRRIGVCGLSLGGETTMYVAALDERVRVVDSSGWLTTVANMKNGHCPCWNFPGLEEHFDFSDIFACIAPRPLVCEIGDRERAPGGFPIDIAREAFQEIRAAYAVFGAEEKAILDHHPYGHVFVGREFWGLLHSRLGVPDPWRRQASPDAEALRRGEIARRCFARALGVFEGWWALRDPHSQLFPRRTDQPVWAPQDNAADMLPFLFLTSHYIAPERYPELMLTLSAERSITSRLGPLPDWWSIKDRTWVYPTPDVPRILFNAAEYCKDGLNPMTEAMGRGPWLDRMEELMEAIWAHAPVKTDHGMLPASDTEVLGDIMQALSRLYSIRRKPEYVEWLRRIGDAYCLEVLPRNGGLPADRWDFARHAPANDSLNMSDHGNEAIFGLAELYIAMKQADPARAALYEGPLRTMYHRLLERARNADGLFYHLLRSSTAEVLNKTVPDTWGYTLCGVAAFGQASGDRRCREAPRAALRNLDKPVYLDWNGADSFADSIESGILLLNRWPVPQAARWLERILPVFLSKQEASGIVEGWYGDGNYARTALMAALYFTQGANCLPWRSDLRYGAVRDGRALRVVIAAETDWHGQLRLDRPRHRLHMNLPSNYPRLNEFPEWFTVDAETIYEVRLGKESLRLKGADLAKGVPVNVRGGERLVVTVRPR